MLYINEEQGEFYANLVLNKILDAVEHLGSFPRLGPIEPLLSHKKSEYRYAVAWSYKIIYRVAANKIVIARVFHTAQKPTKRVGKA